jgi:hypothetical protein
VKYNSDSFYTPSNLNISEVLKKVVNHESPIHRDEAARRVVSHWGMKAVKRKIRNILTIVESYCEANRMIKCKGNFLWSMDMKRPRVRSRDSEDVSKNIKFISPEEIGEASFMVLKKEYSMPKKELINQTAKLLGFNRTTENIDEYIWRSIHSYIKDCKILEKNGRLTFNNDDEKPKVDGSIKKDTIDQV